MTPRTRSRSPLRRAPLHLIAALGLALLPSPSSGAEPVAAPPGQAVLADLPMLLVAGSNRVHFDLAAPGDPPLPVMLDTSVRNAIAGTRALEKLGGERMPSQTEVYSRRTVLGRSLSVAAWSRSESPFVRLGGRFLSHYVLELDFVSRRVRFLDPAQVELPEVADDEDEAVVDLEMVVGLPYLKVSINERPTRVALDTSALVPLWLMTRELTKSAVSPKTLPILRPRGDRQSTLRVFETDLVQLGSTNVGVFPVFVAQEGHSDELGAGGFVLGLDLLSQFHVKLDPVRGRLWLRRTGSTPVRFAGLPYSLTRDSGAYISPSRNRFEVFGVLPGSPAEAMGLLPGDRIDPEKVEIATHRELLKHIGLQAPLLVDRPLGKGGPFEEVLLPRDRAPVGPR